MKYQCPCCGYFTLPEKPPGTYYICDVCFWEDDPIQYKDHDYKGGANRISLNQARINYARFGAKEEKYINDVRKPLDSEREAHYPL
jgi:hypothetical protein